MLLPLQTRPDLGLIVLVGIIALIIFFVKMARDVQTGVNQPTSNERRNVLETLLAMVVTLFLLAYTLPDAISSLEKESDWLIIESGETYTVSEGETEEYVGIEDNGTLNLNGTIALRG